MVVLVDFTVKRKRPTIKVSLSKLFPIIVGLILSKLLSTTLYNVIIAQISMVAIAFLHLKDKLLVEFKRVCSRVLVNHF